MKLLLTGLEGFTGRHLAQAAHAAGYEVIGLKADLTDPGAVGNEVLEVEPTHVVHLAAVSAVTHADEEAFYRINLFGTLNLLKALTALPLAPKKVLLASSANVYGNQRGSEIAETVCPKPVNHYAMSKLAMECMAATYADRLPLVVTRPFNYTGVGQGLNFVIPKIVDHFARKASVIELGNLDVCRDYSDVRQVCKVYLDLLDVGLPSEMYNICTGRAVSLREILALMIEITGWNPEIRINPAFVRSNEIFTLTGSTEKLVDCVGSIPDTNLKMLLEWMYSAAKNGYAE